MFFTQIFLKRKIIKYSRIPENDFCSRFLSLKRMQKFALEAKS